MSYEIPGFTRSYEAVADLSGSRFKFVKMSGGVIVAVTAATDAAVGVLQNMPNRPSPGGVFQGGERTAGTVMIDGVSRVLAGKALAAGVTVYLDATGRVTDVAQAGKAVGVTETAAANPNEVVSVLLKPLGSLA